jgi:hypothetical protein
MWPQLEDPSLRALGCDAEPTPVGIGKQSGAPVDCEERTQGHAITANTGFSAPAGAN